MEAKLDITSMVKEQPKFKHKKRVMLKRGIKSSKMIEVDYYSQLAYMINTIRERFENTVLAGVDTVKVKEVIHDESWHAKVNRLISEWKTSIKQQFHVQRLNNTAKVYVNKADKYQQTKFNTMIEYGFGIDIANIPEFKAYKPFIKMAIKRNLSLITSLRNDALDKLETMLRVAVEQGTSIANISKEITKSSNVSKKRAVMVARNEIKNVTSMLTKKRLQNVGFEQAEWQTSEDERVRPDHKKFNGKIFKIGTGLKNSMGIYEEPGDAIACRCVAIPYLELD